MINGDGIIKEWLTPKLDNNDAHRHSSQLYDLYDGITKEIEESKELQEAFKKSIEFKLDKHWRNNPVGFMSFGLVQLGQAATSLGEGELAYECLQYLVNRFWLNNLASMHNHKSLFNMDISGGMPAVIIKMMVASEPGKISLLPALPSKFQTGSIEGVLCRGHVEILRLSWDKQKITVRMKSGKEQKLVLAMPSEIKSISIENGIGQIDNGENRNEKVISLIKDNVITINIEI